MPAVMALVCSRNGAAEWDGRILYAVGQNFQPDVRLESLTRTCAIRSSGAISSRFPFFA